MHLRFAPLAALPFSVFLSSCSFIQGVPSPDYAISSEQSPDRILSVSDLVNHIECEIASDKKLSTLADRNYTAQITLTLKADENIGLSPSLSFITPYKATGTSMTDAVNANINAQRQRTYTATFAISLAKLGADTQRPTLKPGEPKPCPEKGVFSLSGDLGIDEVIDAGLATNDYSLDYVAPSGGGGSSAALASAFASTKMPSSETTGARTASEVRTLQAQKNAETQQLIDDAQAVIDAAKNGAARPVGTSFGSTIIFTIVRTADVGPNWVIKHFKGPSGSKGILNGGRTATDTLIIAFSPAKSTLSDLIDQKILELAKIIKPDQKQRDLLDELKKIGPLLKQTEASQAGITTQTLTNNMILQNLSIAP